MIVTQLHSGTIDLEMYGGKLYLQFNCLCRDALPYCRAMCCRNRPEVNVLIDNSEVETFVTTTVGPFRVLEWADGDCVYLDSMNRCMIHNTKPHDCVRWHCSPHGIGLGLTIKEKGWLVSSDGFGFQER